MIHPLLAKTQHRPKKRREKQQHDNFFHPEHPLQPCKQSITTYNRNKLGAQKAQCTQHHRQQHEPGQGFHYVYQTQKCFKLRLLLHRPSPFHSAPRLPASAKVRHKHRSLPIAPHVFHSLPFALAPDNKFDPLRPHWPADEKS